MGDKTRVTAPWREMNAETNPDACTAPQQAGGDIRDCANGGTNAEIQDVVSLDLSSLDKLSSSLIRDLGGSFGSFGASTG